MKTRKSLSLVYLLVAGLVLSETSCIYSSSSSQINWALAQVLMVPLGWGITMTPVGLMILFDGLDIWKHRHIPLTAQQKINYLLEQQLDPALQKQIQERNESLIKRRIKIGAAISILGTLTAIISGIILYYNTTNSNG